MPYRLYALSNAGSLLALLGDPFVVEPGWEPRWAGAWLERVVCWFRGAGRLVAWVSRRPRGKDARSRSVGSWEWCARDRSSTVGNLSAICLVAGVLARGWLIGILSGLVGSRRRWGCGR
ncbi:MAG: hypothetical protein Ct9H300mP1_09820 [Planctomycetaceae bacterium]|nr:MAG: hypothetical protein Ct9H300mP1_09820 [Planctomycetaceae bacterium]